MRSVCLCVCGVCCSRKWKQTVIVSVAECQWCWGPEFWEVGARAPQRVGCWAVLTFASVLLSGGDGSSGPSVFLATSPLTPLVGAAGGPARPQLLLLRCFSFLNLSACVFECEVLINVVSIPFCPITPAPLEGSLAGQPLTPPPPPPLSRAESAVVILPVFMCCKSSCSPKDLLWLFFFFFCPPSPWALSMSLGQSLVDSIPALDHGSF